MKSVHSIDGKKYVKVVVDNFHDLKSQILKGYKYLNIAVSYQNFNEKPSSWSGHIVDLKHYKNSSKAKKLSDYLIQYNKSKKIIASKSSIYFYATLEELKNKKQSCFGSVYSWNNCFGFYKFPNGNIYEGEYKNGKRHGKGIYTFADGEKHIGDFKNGSLNGRGISFFISGNKYEGEFKNGKRHGRGVFTFLNGEKYTGEYINGKRNGRGIIIFPNGDNYEGEYKNGKRNGEGIYTFVNGDNYKGRFKNGKRHGEGVLTFASGEKPKKVFGKMINSYIRN